ncbi:MAG: HNH endonuclease signature motif containing protein [Candidatus Paceibacterota bacterium]
MEIIKEIGLRVANDGRKYRFAVFICPSCGNACEKIKRDGQKALYCSHACYAINRKMRGPYKKKIISKKYYYIYMPEHPNARGTRKLYIAEHRLIMEKFIGRYLTEEEIVHHINEDTMDNRIENLQLMTASEHNKFHKIKTKRSNDGKFTIKI